MISIDDSDSLDHAYFQALEEAVIRLRGAPLLLSPADWQLAKEWRSRHIPLSLIIRILEEMWSQPRAEKSKLRSLKYCAAAIDEEWSRMEKLRSSGERRDPVEIDLRPKLDRLAASLPSWIQNREDYYRSIVELTGSVSSVESSLSTIDDDLMSVARQRLAPGEEEEFQARAAKSIEQYKKRLPDVEVRKARDRLMKQMIRRSQQLPVLSLFAPEAQPESKRSVRSGPAT